MNNSIYSDISYHGDRKLPKLKLFFNLPDHACNTMKYHPESVIEEYLKMHLKEEITYDDIFKLIEMDYQSEKCTTSLSSNVMEYLEYYMSIKQLNSFPHGVGRNMRDEYTKKDYDFTPLVEETINAIFKDTREGAILEILKED